jgi:hypothetical protein
MAPGASNGPLMHVQQAVWTLSRQLARTGYGVRPFAIRITGPLDVALLARGCALLLARHSGLRTRFPVVDGLPIQQVVDVPEVALPLVDLSGADDPLSAMAALATDRVHVGFDLTRETPFDPTLIRLGVDDHVLYVRSHHIVFDGWSEHVVISDLASIYAALEHGRPPALDDLAMDPIGLAEAERRHASSAGFHGVLAAWRSTLEHVPHPLALPYSQEPQGPPAGPLGIVDVDVPRSTLERVRARLRERRMTSFVGMLAGFVVLLARATGEDDVVVGATASARTRREVEGVVAYVANELPVRVDLSGAGDFGGALERVQQRFRGAFALQDVPMAQVTDALVGEGFLTDGKLFTVTIQQRSFPPRAMPPSTVSFSPFDVLHGPGVLHLRIHLIPTETSLRVRIHHDPAVYTRVRAEAIAHALIGVVDQGLAAPTKRLSDIDVGLD